MTKRHLVISVAALAFLSCLQLAFLRIASAAPDNGNGVAILSARVDADGTLLSGSGVTGVTKVGTGTYQVDFDREVTECMFSVTPADLRLPQVQPTTSDQNASTVTLWAQIGLNITSSDGQFYLLAYCSR